MFAYGVALPLGVGILAAAFLIFPITERVTNAKQVQLMTGLSPWTFWLANIVWDVAIYFASLTFMLITLFAMDKKRTFTSNGAAGDKTFFQKLASPPKTMFRLSVFTFLNRRSDSDSVPERSQLHSHVLRLQLPNPDHGIWLCPPHDLEHCYGYVQANYSRQNRETCFVVSF